MNEKPNAYLYFHLILTDKSQYHVLMEHLYLYLPYEN